MAQKYFAVSYDNGLEPDHRIIALMKRYGIQGTFNLCSGLFGKKGYIQRIGDLGYRDTELAGKNSCHFVEHYTLERKDFLG